MMRIRLECKLGLPYNEVFDGFDRDLFLYLLPPFSRLLRFDGSRTGDEVHLRLGPFLWISEIVDHGEDEKQSYFVDRGKKLPFLLKTWEHRHIVEKRGSGSVIIDDMRYSSGFFLSDLLLYPFLYLAFFPRLFLYKSWFKRNA